MPPSKLSVEARLVGFLFLATGLFGVAYGARRAWLPPLASRHGAGIDLMLAYLLVTVGVLFLIGYVALGVLIWARLDVPEADGVSDGGHSYRT